MLSAQGMLTIRIHVLWWALLTSTVNPAHGSKTRSPPMGWYVRPESLENSCSRLCRTTCFQLRLGLRLNCSQFHTRSCVVQFWRVVGSASHDQYKLTSALAVTLKLLSVYVGRSSWYAFGGSVTQQQMEQVCQRVGGTFFVIQLVLL